MDLDMAASGGAGAAAGAAGAGTTLFFLFEKSTRLIDHFFFTL